MHVPVVPVERASYSVGNHVRVCMWCTDQSVKQPGQRCHHAPTPHVLSYRAIAYGSDRHYHVTTTLGTTKHLSSFFFFFFSYLVLSTLISLYSNFTVQKYSIQCKTVFSGDYKDEPVYLSMTTGVKTNGQFSDFYRPSVWASSSILHRSSPLHEPAWPSFSLSAISFVLHTY